MRLPNGNNPRFNLWLGIKWKLALIRHCRKHHISAGTFIRQALRPLIENLPEFEGKDYHYTGEWTKEALQAAAIDRILQNAPKKIE